MWTSSRFGLAMADLVCSQFSPTLTKHFKYSGKYEGHENFHWKNLSYKFVFGIIGEKLKDSTIEKA
jgi:hypothetical protein